MLKDILVTFFLDIPFWISAFLLIPIAILFLECSLALLPNNKVLKNHGLKQRPSAAILIPAHNEQQVICQTLSALTPQLTAQDKLIVIADNCTDSTADLAREFEATVIERNDLSKIGKGYALDCGLRSLQSNPPEVVILVDADCIVQPDSIDRLAREAIATKQPVQAVYLMEKAAASNPKNLVSALAFKIKNLVRPSGLNKLNLPCLLTGTGMAFPWSVISNAPLANDNIVEDMQLGIDLAIAGTPPRFCPQAKVTGVLPQADTAAKSQKMRWIHGHLKTLVTQVPRLIKAAFVQRRFDLLAIALDLCIPPVSLLVMAWLLVAGLGLLVAILGGSWHAVVLSAIEGLLICTSILGAWIKFASSDISLKTLLSVPFYILWKIPIFLAFLFQRQQVWVRTARDIDPGLSSMYSLSSQVQAIEKHILSETTEGSIVFQMQSGSYFGLNEIGTQIWKLIQETRTIADIRDAILSEYAVSPEVCLQDIIAILEQLANQELIEVEN